MASEKIDPTKGPADAIASASDTSINATAAAAVKAIKAGKTQDIDIAAQIIAQYSDEGDQTWTEEEEKRLVRKVDWMLVPIVSCSSRPFPCYVQLLIPEHSCLSALPCLVSTRQPSQLQPSTASEKT